jgi:hypothetical protein
MLDKDRQLDTHEMRRTVPAVSRLSTGTRYVAGRACEEEENNAFLKLRPGGMTDFDLFYFTNVKLDSFLHTGRTCK